MFERFSEEARRVVVLAQDEARGLGHSYIGTEHLLLGLLRDEEGWPAKVLESFGAHGHAVRARVVEIVGSSADVVPPGQIPFTPRAKRSLELSLREALSIGVNHIGPEHVLLGVLREREGVAARILEEFGVDAEQVRGKIGPPGFGWTGYAPLRSGRRFRRPRTKWTAMSEARDAALEDGDYELARKLLELEIEARERGKKPDPGAG